jgi:23S rRNA (pseudouridine1915-N3)-methyltransferase
MTWTLLTFDQKTPRWLSERLELYIKRLQYWVSFEHKVIAPSSLTSAQRAQQLDFEKIQDHKHYSKMIFVVFDEKGLAVTSEKLAHYVEQWEQQRDVCFVIGPSYGLSPLWRQQALCCLSLSSLTLTHEFAQLIVTEQLYRAFTILKGLPYHVQ